MPLKSQEFFYIVFKLFESTDHESINFTPYQFLAKFFIFIYGGIKKFIPHYNQKF